MIVPVAIPEVNDLMDNADERELWIVGREFERPPYYHTNEGINTRLAKALRVVQEGRITPNSDGSYTVEGSAHRQYRVAESCSCPQSQKGKSKYCYHFVAVCLYVEWRKRCAPAAPVALGTLRAGTAPLAPVHDDEEALGNGFPVDDETLPLPLPPTSVEERLAQPTGTPAQPFALHLIVEEDRMPDADDGYTPEPDVAVLEPPVAPRALTPVTPQVDDLEAALRVWTTERAVVQRFLKQELKANIDYYTLRIGGKDSKPSLSKAGAEKVLGWLKIQASFTPDTGTWEMLGRPTDLVSFVCTLRTRSGEIVGEGRGARSLKKDGGDVNKAIKMAEKSAMVSAVLRTGALSDVFTQDLEDMQEEPAKAAKPVGQSQELRQRIWAQVQKMDATVRSREQVEAFIKARTGMDLHPDFYEAILGGLEGRV